jgi:hypothetical protein
MHEKVGNGSTIWQALDRDMIAEAQIDPPWHRVNWRRAKAGVRRLQTRIVKATKAGQWRLVRKLQNLLTRSTAAKLLAVRRVTSNRGRKTPGVDGVVLDTPKVKWQAMERLCTAPAISRSTISTAKRRHRVLYGALSKPEPCAGKLACTVLRGLSDGDITQLPDPVCHRSPSRESLLASK